MLKKNFDFVVSYKFGLLSGVILLNSSLVPFDETIQVHSSFPQSTVHVSKGGFMRSVSRMFSTPKTRHLNSVPSFFFLLIGPHRLDEAALKLPYC